MTGSRAGPFILVTGSRGRGTGRCPIAANVRGDQERAAITLREASPVAQIDAAGREGAAQPLEGFHLLAEVEEIRDTTRRGCPARARFRLET